MSLSTSKFKLDNGLVVILREFHHAPAVCTMIWYRVGSRNEYAGVTGISHWVEHLMYSGTPSYPSGEFDRLLSREGGDWNAFTWLDHTAYYETVPAEKADLCLKLEADRMINTRFSASDVEKERSIILSERAMLENDPRFRLSEALSATAFRVHPYQFDVIGSEFDLERITHADLSNFHRKHYVPNNAVLVVTGDFQTKKMLSEILEVFGDIPPGRLIEAVKVKEPAQVEERRIIVEGPGDTAYLTMAFHVPAAMEKDYTALTLFNAAFAGGSSLGMFAGGGTNRSSRIYRAMVENELAVYAGGQLAPTVDPFLYTINVVARAGREPEAIESALNEEMRKLASNPINQKELDAALRRARAQLIMAGESITGQAHLIGMAEVMANDYRWYEQTVERLNAVSVDDLERIRQIYLTECNRTVGWYLPVAASQ